MLWKGGGPWGAQEEQNTGCIESNRYYFHLLQPLGLNYELGTLGIPNGREGMLISRPLGAIDHWDHGKWDHTCLTFEYLQRIHFENSSGFQSQAQAAHYFIGRRSHSVAIHHSSRDYSSTSPLSHMCYERSRHCPAKTTKRTN